MRHQLNNSKCFHRAKRNTLLILNDMGGPQKHYAGRKKPNTNRYILWGTIYMRF